MRLKSIKENEFKNYLWRLSLTGDEGLPFMENYKVHNRSNDYNMFDYLLFIKGELGFYKSLIKLGEKDFQTYLNEQYPPLDKSKFANNVLEELEDNFRENHMEDDQISVKELLEIIEEYKE